MADVTARQERAISALLAAPTLTEAATIAGITDRTLRTWLAEPAFDAAYRAARRESVSQAIARLQQVSGPAVDRLQALLTCGKPAIELGAARTILEMAIKAVELEDIDARLSALEQRDADTHTT